VYVYVYVCVCVCVCVRVHEDFNGLFIRRGGRGGG